MMAKLVQQGISYKAILGGVGQAAGYLAVQLKMPFEDAAEFAAKMQDATKTSEKDMLSLMDTIQRSYYLVSTPPICYKVFPNYQQG
jgi:TP901 family phage tail tape measure protein